MAKNRFEVISEARAEINYILATQPELRVFQQKLEEELKGIETSEGRLELLRQMMSLQLKTLISSLDKIKENADKIISTLEKL